MQIHDGRDGAMGNGNAKFTQIIWEVANERSVGQTEEEAKAMVREACRWSMGTFLPYCLNLESIDCCYDRSVAYHSTTKQRGCWLLVYRFPFRSQLPFYTNPGNLQSTPAKSQDRGSALRPVKPFQSIDSKITAPTSSSAVLIIKESTWRCSLPPVNGVTLGVGETGALAFELAL